MKKSIHSSKQVKTSLQALPCNALQPLHFSWIILLFILFSCQPEKRENTIMQRAFYYQSSGSFNRLKCLADSVSGSNCLNEREKIQLDSLLEISRRILLDFKLSEKEVKIQLARYFPDCDSTRIKNWEKGNKLEMRLINGEKRYFKNAVANLFRLDDEAKKFKIKVDGNQTDPLKTFCLEHTTNVLANSQNYGQPVLPVKMELTYTITVKPNVVPDGKTIRCWMPFPREGHVRQKNIKLLGSVPGNAIIAPGNALQRTIYLEKTARKDEPAQFQVSFEVETSALYFDLEMEDIQPYLIENQIFKAFTCERDPHILFSEKIKELGRRLVGDETNPYKKVRAIYHWINDSVRWASALEYGIITNIPEYVLETRHGDCGMQTLLFMTLARSQGIPVKWQSGWMLHRGMVNLHDWCEVYYEGMGWVPVDQSFGEQQSSEIKLKNFYSSGIDSYRLIVNDDFARPLTPEKKYLRSEPYDFQRGELEWEGGNLYFNEWSWNMDVKYL